MSRMSPLIRVLLALFVLILLAMPAHEAGAAPSKKQHKADKAALYQGDTRTKVMHGPGCKEYRCKTCTALFATPGAGMRGGYKVCARCRPDRHFLKKVLGPPPAAPPRETRSKDRACKRDRDCALLPPAPCGCRPCGYTWLRSANRKHVGWLLKEYAREQCDRSVPCTPCANKDLRLLDLYLGSKAVCLKGQCTTRL